MLMPTGERDCGEIWLGTETSLKVSGGLDEDPRIESKHCPTQKSISDSELMKSSERDDQEMELRKSKQKYWNSSDPELMISSGHNHLEGETGRSQLQQNSSNPEPIKTSEHNDHEPTKMIEHKDNEAQTGKSQNITWLRQNSSDPEPMLRREQNFQEAEAISARNHQPARSCSEPDLMMSRGRKNQDKQAQSAMNLSMRSCSLPELLSKKKNTWKGDTILRSVFQP